MYREAIEASWTASWMLSSKDSSGVLPFGLPSELLSTIPAWEGGQCSGTEWQ